MQEHRLLKFTSSKLSLLLTCFCTYKRFVIHSVVINSFFLDYLNDIALNFSRHVIFATLIFRVTLTSQFFLNREIRDMFHVIR